MIDERVQQLIDKGAIFYASHSGGKDSQDMYNEVSKYIPPDQIVVVHADLGEVEWVGVQDHIRSVIQHPLNIVGAKKTFLGMVEQRGMWPSAAYRQCTSDLKRGPIFKFIRNDLKARGTSIAVNCMGIRAEESTARAKKEPFRYNKAESCGHRDVWDWMPIFDRTTEQVFQSIAEAGQEPFWAYSDGNERLSCVFCIMGSVNDLQHGAKCNPELYRKYVELERKIGHTMFTKGKNPISLEEHTGISIDDLERR
ncbi:phosphoadenosine phosphosulfate reductase family protein [Paenibacillus pabuli]|uniref:phosphoadenosine phosphosulfate reductase domain-containing protein n=1 Tax=Paenibacillus pabuli TaxID=1472 RepID=UPI001FFECB22|nr:phosphoadenosine phosphosulfate reductase family protein [Paenibacillus pabuli]UPK45922.1 phosphoadenosine phosphosulfate reductase family protein [Paenibacillus pabuli]